MGSLKSLTLLDSDTATNNSSLNINWLKGNCIAEKLLDKIVIPENNAMSKEV